MAQCANKFAPTLVNQVPFVYGYFLKTCCPAGMFIALTILFFVLQKPLVPLTLLFLQP
jgi:hypothetical protein